MTMSIDDVRAYLQHWGLQDKILEFDVSSATVNLAAEALHCAPGRIAKTLSFKNGNNCILVVTAGDEKIDNTKFKTVFHCKPKMLSPEEVPEQTGHAVGGVCPFAVKAGASVYADISLKRFPTVFPACGSSNSAIELTSDELYQYSQCAGWVDVCKPRSEVAAE
jgi:prolyl-tRNA editing enzyme YbaK/EbsC (Cys-tRNA(Pro) deacylase)